jgi:HrpA-like RNA helicase
MCALSAGGLTGVVPQVVYVVNSGKLKERRFDAVSGVSTLQSHWASAANNKQRRGRAGR